MSQRKRPAPAHRKTSLIRAAFATLATVAAVATAPSPAPARESSHDEIERGRYLVTAGDCAACHTDDGGKPFAGGRPIPTPFGNVYATNITPDSRTGIGRWTDDQFWKAMHEGIRADGSHLYPTFPYPWYTKVSREDVRAIRAYLDTVEPVRQENRPPALQWPLNWRGGLAVWNALYFERGAYMCPTPPNQRNGTAAPISSKRWAIAVPAIRRRTFWVR